MPLDASEAELAAAAKKAIQPATRKGQERVEAEAKATKEKQAKKQKEGQLLAATVFYIFRETTRFGRQRHSRPGGRYRPLLCR